MIFLGIDIGTTRIKALLHDSVSGAREVLARPTPTTPSPLGDLRNADDVLGAVVEVVEAVTATLDPVQRRRVAGIGVTSLSEEMVLLGGTGAVLGAMPTWYTPCGAEAAVTAGLDPSFSWAKLRWAFDAITTGRSSTGSDAAFGQAATFGEATAEDVQTVTTLNGYVADRLVAAGRYAVDHSHASRTGFFDVASATWREDVFAQTRWPTSTLPPLVETASVVGTITADLAARWDLPEDVVVVLAGHDHFCGAYGMGVRGDGELYVSAGTSEAHCLIVDRLPETALPTDVGIGRFVDGERFYLHRQLPAGHLYRHWRQLLGLQQQTPAEEAATLSARPVGSDGALLLPGFGTDTRSWLLGVGVAADGPTILRALLEGLACAALHVDTALADLAQGGVSAVIAAGVPCQSPVWQEIRAHLSIAPLSISQETEAPALGAALLAQRALTGAAAPAAPSTPVPQDAALLAPYRAVHHRFEEALATLAPKT